MLDHRLEISRAYHVWVTIIDDENIKNSEPFCHLTTWGFLYNVMVHQTRLVSTRDRYCDPTPNFCFFYFLRDVSPFVQSALASGLSFLENCIPILLENCWYCRYPARDLWERAERAWDQIRSMQSIQNQRNTLLVAHNAINQALVMTALGCDATYFRKLAWPNCAVLELQWRRGADRAERYRWVIPEPSPYVEVADAGKILKANMDDNRFTL